MLHNFDQPARDWLADSLENFGILLDNGEDPSVVIDLGNDVQIEVRLNKLGNEFTRETGNEINESGHSQASEENSGSDSEGEAFGYYDPSKEHG